MRALKTCGAFAAAILAAGIAVAAGAREKEEMLPRVSLSRTENPGGPMRNLKTSAAVAVAILVAGLAVAAGGKQEEDALLKVDREWATASSEGKDVDRIVSFWSDDATLYPPGGPVVQGKAALRAFMQKSLATPGFKITWTSDSASVSADGTMGYTTATNSMTAPGPDGKMMTTKGRGISIWRRAEGGAWKCVVNISNSGP